MAVKFSSLSVSDPRMVCLRTCRWRDIYILGGPNPNCRQWYREPDEYRGHAYANRGYFASWTHASQSYLPKSHRGLSLLFHLLRMPTYLSKPADWVKQSIPFSYIAFTAKSLDGLAHALQVYTDVSGGA